MAYRWSAVALGLLVSVGASRPAAAAEEEGWLQSLQTDVRADVAAGKPVVVQVHVPLCDNSVIRCGGNGLGDGNNLRRNLYWATSEGLAGWMDRRDSGWTQEFRASGAAVGEPNVLEVRVWRRDFALPRAWAGPGMPAKFVVRLVGFAWRGTAIDAALSAYLSDLFRNRARVISMPAPTAGTKTDVEAGGAARIVAWVGHNRLMDVAADWNELRRTQDRRFRKGTLAIGCYSANYFRPSVADPSRVPLLMTASLIMASSAALEGGVMAFFAGGDLAEIRAGGAAGYAKGQHRPIAQVKSGFTNPSDRRW